MWSCAFMNSSCIYITLKVFFLKIMQEHLQNNHMMLVKQLTQWIQESITKQFMHKKFIWGSFVSLNIGTLKFTKLIIIYSLDSWNEPTRNKTKVCLILIMLAIEGITQCKNWMHCFYFVFCILLFWKEKCSPFQAFSFFLKCRCIIEVALLC
jgi:hypothetical protein